MHVYLLFLFFSYLNLSAMQPKEHEPLPDSFYGQKAKKFIFQSNLITISSRIQAKNYLKKIIKKCDTAHKDKKQQTILLNLLDPGYIWKKDKPNKQSHDYFRFQFADLAYRFLMFHIRFQIKCYFGELTPEEKPFNLKKVTQREFQKMTQNKYKHEDYITIQIYEAKELANTLLDFMTHITPK